MPALIFSPSHSQPPKLECSPPSETGLYRPGAPRVCTLAEYTANCRQMVALGIGRHGLCEPGGRIYCHYYPQDYRCKVPSPTHELLKNCELLSCKPAEFKLFCQKRPNSPACVPGSPPYCKVFPSSLSCTKVKVLPRLKAISPSGKDPPPHAPFCKLHPNAPECQTGYCPPGHRCLQTSPTLSFIPEPLPNCYPRCKPAEFNAFCAKNPNAPACVRGSPIYCKVFPDTCIKVKVPVKVK
jgi:hypothetical protein